MTEKNGQTTVIWRGENVSVNSMLRACEKVTRRETDDLVVCSFQYSTIVSAQVKTIQQEASMAECFNSVGASSEDPEEFPFHQCSPHVCGTVRARVNIQEFVMSFKM